MMGLICYMPKKHLAYERFKNVVESLAPELEIDMFDNFNLLLKRLCQPFRNSKIFVLVATDEDELNKMVTLKEHLLDVPIVLILPNGDVGTVEKGYSLYPRFISYVESDFGDVAAVLKKMVQRYAA